MLHWRALLTLGRRSLRRVHGLWRKATCFRQSQHGSRSTTTVLLKVLVMVNLLILLTVLYDVLTALRLLPTNLRSYVVEGHCMGGLPPFTDSLERLCKGVSRLLIN